MIMTNDLGISDRLDVNSSSRIASPLAGLSHHGVRCAYVQADGSFVLNNVAHAIHSSPCGQVGVVYYGSLLCVAISHVMRRDLACSLPVA